MILIVENDTLPTIESGSEFLEACSNIEITELLEIMDDLMQDVAILYPMKYKAVIREISRTKRDSFKN